MSQQGSQFAPYGQEYAGVLHAQPLYLQAAPAAFLAQPTQHTLQHGYALPQFGPTADDLSQQLEQFSLGPAAYGQGQAPRAQAFYFPAPMAMAPPPMAMQAPLPLGVARGGGRGRGMMGPGRGVVHPGPAPKRRPQKGMEDNVRRTVYISYIDIQVTEEQLANFFLECGRILDCRICGDPNSAMRFAFIEFAELDGAQAALQKTGTILGSSPLRVLPSKTAIVPVNKDLMPRSQDDIERCSRTVYVANIDKKVDRNDVRNFFEQLCGKVSKIRLLGDYAHTTRIAFIEFMHAEGAMAALNCSGALLGSLPIRVSPSKTPVRSESGSADRSNRGSASGHSNAASQQQQQQQQQGGEQQPGQGVVKEQQYRQGGQQQLGAHAAGGMGSVSPPHGPGDTAPSSASSANPLGLGPPGGGAGRVSGHTSRPTSTSSELQALAQQHHAFA